MEESFAIQPSQFVSELLEILEPEGEAWLVGGFVRDSLLGLTPGDADLACSLPPDRTTALLEQAGIAVFPTGIRHGTVTAVRAGETAEITAFRTDGPYTDGRHPDFVAPAASIEEDLARRDFTVNAMAWHPARGLVDSFGGRKDLAAGIIRCVGEPKQRFREDSLRIVRALRFASQLGFSIDPATESAAESQSYLMETLAAERVRAELTKMLLGPNVLFVLLNYRNILGTLLPELVACFDFPQKTKYHCYDVWEHTARTVDAVPAAPVLRWTALLHDAGKPAAHTNTDGVDHFKGHAIYSTALAQSITERLKFPKDQAREILLLVRLHDNPVEPTFKSVRKMLHRLEDNPDFFTDLCEIKAADGVTHAPEYRDRAAGAEQLKTTLREMLAQQELFTLSNLAVDGNDILSLGAEPGPPVGRILRTLLEAVEEELLPNEREALMQEAGLLLSGEKDLLP